MGNQGVRSACRAWGIADDPYLQMACCVFDLLLVAPSWTPDQPRVRLSLLAVVVQDL